MSCSRFVSALMVGILASCLVHVDVRAEEMRLSNDEPCAKEQWPSARVLVWATPGVSGSATDSRNWTEYASAADYMAKKEGRSAKRSPDEDTDIVMPAAPEGKSYTAGYIVESYRRRGGLDHPQWACRHITIGKGAGLDVGSRVSRGKVVFGSHDTTMAIYGNVTIQDGGYLYGPRYFLGDRHTYVSMGDSPEPLDKSWVIRKTNNASITLLGKPFVLAEGVAIESGRLVLHSKSELHFGAGYEARVAIKKLRGLGDSLTDGYVYVHKDAALEMRAGSRLVRAKQPEYTIADVRIKGLLQIGRPGEKNGEPSVIELTTAEGDGGFLRQSGGLYIQPAAQIKNFGKLVITSRAPHAKATARKGVSIFVEEQVDLGQVSLNYLRSGGIAAVNLAIARAAVSKATFGTHCAASGDELFSTFDAIDFQGGVGTVDFVDGLKTDCKILYPHAGRLIVRGKGNRTLQSFDLKIVHAVTIDGRRTEYNAKRPLSAKEQTLRGKNPLWGDVPGKGQYGKYAQQDWTDCPVMIWASPGVSGLRFTGPNWLDETGRPYFEVPLISQRNVKSDNPPIDMLMPASDTPYSAGGWGAGGSEGGPPCRHLTVEYNATYGITYNVQGNLWMKHGSGLVGKHRGRFFNEQPDIHRFLRFDGKRKGKDGTLVDGQDGSAALGQWGDYGVGEGSTLEVIGRIRCAVDRAYVRGHGTLIISEGSVLADGNRAAFSIGPDSTVALLEDAQLGHEISMQVGGCASISCAGTLMFGLPDRPIRKDTVFGVPGMTSEQINRTLGGGGRSPGASLIFSPQSRLIIHSADPSKARVIIRMHDSELARSKSKGNPEGIVCYFGGKSELNGVVFDNILEGGIMAPPAARATWKNVFYGKHNLAEPGKLNWDLKVEGDH